MGLFDDLNPTKVFSDFDGTGGTFNRLADPLDLFGGRANKQASDVQSALAAEALALQKEFADLLQKDAAPVRNTRDLAIGALRNGSPLQLDPSLGFQRNELVNRLNRGAVASGKFNSGQRLQQTQDLDASLASNATRQAQNRLLNIAGFNTRDLSNQNSLLQRNFDQQGNQIQFQGDLSTARRVGQINNLTGGVTNAVQLGAGFYNQAQQNQLRDQQINQNRSFYG